MNAFRRVYTYFKNAATLNNYFNYSVVYGFLSCLVVFIKQFVTVVFSYDEISSKITNYLIIIIYSFVLLAIFIVIYSKKYTEKDKLAYSFIMIYPFLFILLGVAILSVYDNPFSINLSIITIITYISWASIYKPMRRVLVFSFAIIAYIAFGFMKYDDRELIYNNNTVVLMISFIHFLISTIIYTIFGNHNSLFKALESQIVKTNNTINQLNSANTELKNSKAITDSMYELSQEVLKNEDFSKVLQMVLDKAVTLIPKSQAGSILVLEEGQMHYKAAKGYNLKNLQKIVLDPDELYQATLDDMYSPFIIRNLRTFDEVQLGKDKSEKLWESAVKIAKSCMTCSFKYDNEFFGSINMDNFESEDIFNDKDMYMIKQLAHEIEILISIHMLYKKSIDSSRIDYLTGAFTRKYTISQIEELINNDNESFGICILDINDFKMVNDKFGHDAGDKCLTYFSNAIQEAKSENAIFGRFGGDEFLLVVKNASREDTIKEIDNLKKWFDNNTFDCNKESKKISFAAGYAMFPEDSNSIMELIKIADINMYKDKKNR